MTQHFLNDSALSKKLRIVQTTQNSVQMTERCQNDSALSKLFPRSPGQCEFNINCEFMSILADKQLQRNREKNHSYHCVRSCIWILSCHAKTNPPKQKGEIHYFVCIIALVVSRTHILQNTKHKLVIQYQISETPFATPCSYTT